MLQAWLSIGYIVLLAILVLAFILWRRGVPFWPSLHSCWVSPSGLDGNTHVMETSGFPSANEPCPDHPFPRRSDVQSPHPIS